MKYFNICLLFIICALCYGLVSAQDDGAPASPAKRIAALRRPVGKAAKATTTTTPAPSHNDGGEEEDYGDENLGEHQGEGEEDEAGLSSTTSTTTEAPKKVGPVIRPFRSNDDFLNSLKRRQQNAKKHRAEKPAASKQTSTGKKSDASSGEQEEQEHEPVAAAAPVPASTPAKGYKGNSALSRRKLSKPIKASPEPANDEGGASEESEPKEDTKPKRPIGRLALRKRN